MSSYFFPLPIIFYLFWAQASLPEEPPKNPIRIAYVSKLEKIHIHNRQVILDALNLGWDGRERLPRLIPQIDDEKWVLRVREGNPVHKENNNILILPGINPEQLLYHHILVCVIIQELHISVKPTNRLSYRRTDIELYSNVK